MQKWIGCALLWAVLPCVAACNAPAETSSGSGIGAAPVAGAPSSAPPPAVPSIPAPAAGDLPCDVAEILSLHCADCHGAMLRLGAPVSLVSAASFQAERQGQTVGALVRDRIQNASKPMPPAPLSPLSAEQIAVLARFIDAGANAANPGCAVMEASQPAQGGAGGAMQPTAGAGGAGGAGGAPGPTAPQSSNDWPMFGHDLGNARSNPLETTLSSANVAGLRQLWAFNGPSTTSTPAIVEGIAYLPGWDGKVYALRADDGSEVWTATLPDLIDSSPAVTATRVFVSDDAGSVHALDRATGSVAWSQRVDAHPEAHLWSSPVYIEDAGLVVVGVASSEEAVRASETAAYSFRGSVVALEADSGAERWRFYTTDDDGVSGPGVAVWGTAAVDTDRKLIYIGTGNNYAEPAGPYSDSLLAIDYETGMLAWSIQFTEGDVFSIYGAQGPDFDIGSSANLFSAGGKDLVGIGVKSGTYFALDRDAGAIEWMAQLTPGGVLGGVISAAAYADGMIYVASNDQRGGKTVVAALHAEDGAVAWRHEAPMLTYGGVAHANGVVYVGTTAGSILALDAATGAVRWSDQTPDSIAGSPAVASGMLLVPWGYQWTLREGMAGTGGLIAYGL